MYRDLKTRFILWLARTVNPPVLRDRPLQISPEALRQLPEGTLGREVVRFWEENQFEPIDSGDFIQRTHDVWHVVTGLSASEHDEIMLQAFTRAQVFRPTSAVIVLYGLFKGTLTWRELRHSLRHGRLAERLIHWDVESDWATPLSEVRRKLGLPEHPLATLEIPKAGRRP
jgi:ubiquinone biosynthesis protein COQ4